jgi:signal transduction histidine kinase
MPPPRALESVSRLLEILVSSTDAEVRDRVLVETVLAAGAGAAALWRPYRLGADTPPTAAEGPAWMPLLAVGRVEALPDDALVRGVLEGGLDPDLRDDARVLRGGARGRRVALVVGGLPDDLAVERIESLLLACTLVEDAERAGGADDGFLERVPPPLPADEEARELRRVGHDLRNLLAGAMATKQLLDEFGHELSPGQFEDSDRVLEHECRRVGSLLSTALAGGERDACRMARALETLAAVGRAQAEFARTQGVALEIDAAPSADDRPLALAEEDLGRVAVNLLANAREAVLRGRVGSGGVRLESFVSRGAPGLVLVVEDDGPGLPDVGVAELLAEGFSRGKPGGSGLGLAVAARLVSGCGGRLRARNRPQGGARFEVWIPLCERSAPARGPVAG